jgi:hypothetical protein
MCDYDEICVKIGVDYIELSWLIWSITANNNTTE